MVQFLAYIGAGLVVALVCIGSGFIAGAAWGYEKGWHEAIAHRKPARGPNGKFAKAGA